MLVSPVAFSLLRVNIPLSLVSAKIRSALFSENPREPSFNVKTTLLLPSTLLDAPPDQLSVVSSHCFVVLLYFANL